MRRSKRTRADNEDVSGAKKFKQSNLLSFVSAKQSKVEDGITTEVVTTGSEYISNKLLAIEENLSAKLKTVTFPSPVQYVYNPLEYAAVTHAMYVRKYCDGPKKIMFVGMNPGPWGMSQTGVPFGEISMVRDWLGISGPVGRPPKEHPERVVQGFDCPRSEVSGFRLWGLLKELCGTPENFFKHAYMHNYCPLGFMDSTARNITPAELKGEAQTILHEACDKSLVDIVKLLNVEIIVGIGNYAEKRAQIAKQIGSLKVQVMVLRHPSPRVTGNQNWKEIALERLKQLGLLKYLKKSN